MNFIELYIDGKKADLTTVVSVPMNYELEKLSNPTIIKNNFSKTISLEATPTNNDIFSYYYDLTKVHTGVGFCANKRIPFELFRDNELIESGYLQLNSIKHKSNKYTYEITLYGGLGDFLYSLAYDEEGNEKTLADLYYGYGEDDADFQFRMNADTVVNAWRNVNTNEKNLIGETLNFIPSYNGLYEDFDNNKVLINTNSQTTFPSSINVDNTNYNTINGYGMVELNTELNEWEIRDLRCYKQRPALRLKKFIEAICNPKNNGGYEVELDEKYFFNRENSYYEDTWIALPLLNPDTEEWETSPTEINASSVDSFDITHTGDYPEDTIDIDVYGETADLVEEFGGNANIDISCDFSLQLDATGSNVIMCQNPGVARYNGLGVWLEATVNGTVVGISDCLVFTSALSNNGQIVMPDKSYFASHLHYPKTNFYYYNGSFKRADIRDSKLTYFGALYTIGTPFYEGEMFGEIGNTFRLTLKNVPNYKNVKYSLRSAFWFNSNAAGWKNYFYLNNSTQSATRIEEFKVVNITYPTANIEINDKKPTLQNVNITKQVLLKNKITPSSLLLSFTKLFGLYFVKDVKKKHIKLLTKNTFFKNADILDIDNRIDYSNEVKIEPLMFNKKWYKLVTPSLETTISKDYKADYYEAEYGQKRINTNYNFNTDTEDLYKDNQYQNVITMLDSSKYYRNLFSKTNTTESAPTFAIDTFTYKLWKDADVENVGEKEMYRKNITLPNPIVFGSLVGQDAFPKLCCYDKDEDKKSLNDLSISLVFYSGNKYLTDVDGNPIWYTVSNDLPLMGTINDGTPMYLWSITEYDKDGEHICCRTNEIPQFTRYNFEGGKVYKSLDFGVPYETYISETYSEETTLYNQFWQKFYQDQFNENTRKVTAYVKFDDIKLGNHSLSNFYFFNNSYWLLNKIIDYDLANPQRKVKCEFIKVNNTTNYTDGQQTFTPLFEVDPEYDRLEDWNVLTNSYVSYGDSWEVEFTAIGGIQELSISITDVPNNEIQNYYKVESVGGDKYKLTIFNIKGDVSLYISGKPTTEINVAYYFGDGVTPTTGHSHQFLQMAFEQPSENNIVFTNVVDESDSMSIYQPSPSKIYTRINPNPFYDNENRLMLGFHLYVKYDDGTQKIVTISSSTDQWSSVTDIDTTKVVESIEFKVYQFADASYVPSPTSEE